MAKKIVKVEETKKEKKKSNIDLKKIGTIIVENKDTIDRVIDLVGDKLNTKSTKTSKGTKKSSKTKIKSKKSSSSALDLLGNLLK